MTARGGQGPAAGTATATAGLERPVELGVLMMAVVSGAVLFWRGADDAFTLPRLTALGACAIFLAGYWLTGLIRGDAGLRWKDPGLLAPLAVVVLLAAAAATAEQGWIALIGAPTRGNGLLPYLAYATLFLAAVQLDRRGWRILSKTMVVLLGLVAGYGLLQWLGADPLTWPTSVDGLGTIFATFGQANFAAGWLAIAVPFAALAVVDQVERRWFRGVSVAVLVAAVVFLRAADSFQGVPAALVGLLPLAALLWRRWRADPEPGRRRLASLAVGAALGVLLIVAIVPGTRHYVRSNIDSGLRERTLLWEAGRNMVGEAPILGKGVAAYAAEFTKHRPREHAERYPNAVADAPHSVPLEYAVDGGVPLLLAYLAFVGIVGWRLVQGLGRDSDLLLAAVGGAWLAYQVQSLVSFDVPSLASMHWILAGGVLALTRTAVRAPSGGAPAGRRPAPATWSMIGVVVAGLLMVAVSPLLTRPLRGSVAVHRARVALGRGEGFAALEDLRRASDLSPWSGPTWALRANLFQQAQQPEQALDAGRRAVSASPGSTQYRISLAQLAGELGNRALAEQMFREARRRDPFNSAIASSQSLYEASLTAKPAP